MGKFGWSYPPGAANDPHAPYNEEYYDDSVAWENMLTVVRHEENEKS